jgi:hypothetical protein
VKGCRLRFMALIVAAILGAVAVLVAGAACRAQENGDCAPHQIAW